jgi:hypothetical protein
MDVGADLASTRHDLLHLLQIALIRDRIKLHGVAIQPAKSRALCPKPEMLAQFHALEIYGPRPARKEQGYQQRQQPRTVV